MFSKKKFNNVGRRLSLTLGKEALPRELNQTAILTGFGLAEANLLKVET